MNIEQAKKVAINKVISICGEVGIKYRKIDFEKNANIVVSATMSGNVTIVIYFDEIKCGREVKRKKQDFYNYYNCRVKQTGVRFEFSAKELEIENTAVDVDEKKLEEVLVKIQKLLALSHSDNEHEAISASLMAQKLLAKYNLDIADIDGGQKEQESEEICADVGTGNKWKYNLATVIARNYRCKHYYNGSDRIIFYGYRQDILIARSVYMYLFNVCKRLGRNYEKKERESYGYAEGIYNSYCTGFIAGVDAELSKQCRELMIITPQKVEHDFEVMSAGFGTKNTNVFIKEFDKSAYQTGVVEGRNALNARYVEDKAKYIE